MSKETELVRLWWSRDAVGRRILESGQFSESELLRLIPNNWKKMHGLPATRVPGKKKRARKNLWKHQLFMYVYFCVAADIVEETLPKKMEDTYARLIDVS